MTNTTRTHLIVLATSAIVGDAVEGGGCVWRQHQFVCPDTCGDECSDNCCVDNDRVEILNEAADLLTVEDLRKAIASA